MENLPPSQSYIFMQHMIQQSRAFTQTENYLCEDKYNHYNNVQYNNMQLELDFIG